MKKIIQLEGLDCAGCAAELEAKIAALDGVLSASLAFVNQKLTVEYDAEQTLEKVLYVANHFEEVHVVDEKDRGSSALTDKKTLSPERKKRRLEWILIAFSSMFFVGGILLEYLAQGLAAEICSYVCYGIAYFSVGYPVLFSTAKNICKGKIFDENFLMTIASVGAVLLGEYFEGVAVMLLYQIGETLQGMAVASSRRSVSALMELKSEWATVFKGREQKKVTPEEICVGDILFVKAGEKVPVDGGADRRQGFVRYQIIDGGIGNPHGENGRRIAVGVYQCRCGVYDACHSSLSGQCRRKNTLSCRKCFVRQSGS